MSRRAQPKFFTQWRPARSIEGRETLYVCSFWRTFKTGGKTKQAGCSYSTERHGIEGAARLAFQKAAKHHPIAESVDEIINKLTW